MANKPRARLSIYVPSGEDEAGGVALDSNGQLSRVLGIMASMSNLSCAEHIPGQQCRIEAGAQIDDEHPKIVNVQVECPLSSADCQNTCDGLLTFLKSDHAGSLSFEEEIAFID